ncbi:MAG: thiosulfate oxidation carrier complex protein SoxZ [Pseudomonadota bacterium]|nr:thiosulfate oxidation carrier complex protein SoxZ [Pseudomonadota bacterium]
MKRESKIRARIKGGETVVRVLIRHPMETGARKDDVTGKRVPRHFVQHIEAERNGRVVLSGDWGWGMSSDPNLGFSLEGGKPGDVIRVTWVDNKGDKGELEAVAR